MTINFKAMMALLHEHDRVEFVKDWEYPKWAKTFTGLNYCTIKAGEVGTIIQTTIEPSMPQAAPVQEEDQGIEPNEIWCLERKDNPDVALCGRALMGPIIPHREIPEELLCKECLEEYKRGER